MRFGVIADPDSAGTRPCVDNVMGACAEVGQVMTGVNAIAADVVVVADHVRGGSELATALERRARHRTPMLGVGRGFGVLCELGLLDGHIEPVQGFAMQTYCIVEGRPTPFTAAIPAGRHLAATRAWSARYVADDCVRLESESRVVMRFCSPDGEALAEDAIAGVCDLAGLVVGVLPSCDGSLFRAALAWKRGTPARV